tara:strand:+ start:281 stop:502 length:222 start_codon:yes stop_codon:yes gene_type:complete
MTTKYIKETNKINELESKIESLKHMVKVRDKRIADDTESFDSLSSMFDESYKEKAELKIIIKYLEQKIEKENN